MTAKYNTKQQALMHFEDVAKEFLQECRDLAIQIASTKGEVCIDDIRAQIEAPVGVSPAVFGSVFKGKDWRFLRYQPTSRGTSHSRDIKVWALKNYDPKPNFIAMEQGLIFNS